MLKLIACLTMLIDHLGYTFFSDMLWLRGIGRIAFPLFAWYVAIGHRRTHSPWRYLARMAGWAFLSQIPFALLFHGASISEPASFLEGMNVLFTFLFALLALRLLEMTRSRHWSLHASAWVAAAGLAWLAEFISTDYGFYGVSIVILFSIFDRREQLILRESGPDGHPAAAGGKRVILRILLPVFLFGLTFVFVTFMHMHPIQLLCVAAIPLIWMNLPDPRPGKWKIAFYAFYPVHILIIWLVTRLPLS